MTPDRPVASIAPDQPIFTATLTPHRSLSPAGMRIVLAVVAALSIVSAAPFIALGAWPVGGFFGADLALLYLCFRLNNAHARCSEQVILSRVELLVRKFGWRGDVAELRFNPVWVRLKTDNDPDYGMQRLAIVQRRQEIEVGAFLAPFEREDFARAFRGALHEARR